MPSCVEFLEEALLYELITSNEWSEMMMDEITVLGLMPKKMIRFVIFLQIVNTRSFFIFFSLNG